MKVSCAAVVGGAMIYCSLFLLGYVGTSSRRVKRDHGLHIPRTAETLSCRGNAWMHTFSDSDAVSVFEMSAADVPSLVSQLTLCDTADGDISFPVDSRNQIHRPWMAKTPLRTYRCVSPIHASALDVQVWQADEAHVGVLLYTDWN